MDDACDYTVACVLPFAGVADQNINSIVLVTNGVCTLSHFATHLEYLLMVPLVDLLRYSSCSLPRHWKSGRLWKMETMDYYWVYHCFYRYFVRVAGSRKS